MADTGSSRLPEIGGFAGNPESGTALASIDYIKSARRFDGKPPASTWGGARNRGDRASDALTLKQAAGVIAATRHAMQLGLPVNRHVTVHWQKMGVADCDVVAAIGALMTLHRQFLASHGQPFACIWIRENDDAGGGAKGAHAHILMHVAPDAARVITGKQRGWLERVTGARYRKGALKTTRIGGRVRTATASPAVYHPNLDKVVGYVLKGVDAGAASILALPRHGEGGRVIGKRCGWSENIGAAARARC